MNYSQNPNRRRNRNIGAGNILVNTKYAHNVSAATAMLGWMNKMTAIEPELGQEFGMNPPWSQIEEL